MTIAIDFDDTLNFSVKNGNKFNPNFDLIKILRIIKEDKGFYLVTARRASPSNVSFITEFMIEYSLEPFKMYFTDGQDKGPILSSLPVDYLIDDNEKQRLSSEDFGVNSIHPDEFILIKGSIERKSFLKKYMYKSSSKIEPTTPASGFFSDNHRNENQKDRAPSEVHSDFEKALEDAIEKSEVSEAPAPISNPLDQIPMGDFEGYYDFQKWLRSNRDKIPELQRQLDIEIEKQKEKYKESIAAFPKVLYHGTTIEIANSIAEEGFKITEGLRAGILGSNVSVQNQAIFLSDTKDLATSFGKNRTSSGRQYVVLEVRSSINNTLDMTKWSASIPLSLRRLMLSELSEWEGERITRPRQEDFHWFLDQESIVSEIKKMGYDSVKFSESTSTKKSFGLPKDSGYTYAVFDPAKLEVFNPPKMNAYKFLKDRHDKKNKDMLDYLMRL